MSEDTKRLNIVVSNDLHKNLKVTAAMMGITLQQFVSEAIAEKIKKDYKVLRIRDVSHWPTMIS